MNHRCCRRHAVDIHVTLSVQGGCRQARITNISRGAAFVSTDACETSAVDTVAKLEVGLPSSRDVIEKTTLYGVVVHATERGLGMMFINEDDAFFERLYSHLQHDRTKVEPSQGGR